MKRASVRAALVGGVLVVAMLPAPMASAQAEECKEAHETVMDTVEVTHILPDDVHSTVDVVCETLP